MKNILLLGGLGFIGKNLVEEFCADAGYSVIVFDTPAAAKGQDAPQGEFIFYGGDFNSGPELEKVFREHKIDLVVHLISTTIPAGSTGSEIVYDIESNLVPTVKLLGLMHKYRVPKIVFASSGGTVYGRQPEEPAARNVPETGATNPICSHGTVKLAIEKYICLSSYLHGLDYLILRLSNPYGEHHASRVQGLINVVLKKALAGQTVTIWGDGEIVRDYLYIKDCAKAVKALVDKGISGETLNVGSGTGHSVNEILGMIKEVAGEFTVVREKPRKFDVPRSVLDIGRLRSFIDFEPTDIRTGIRNTFAWLSRNKPA